jgi:dipeptidyl aminopeptidase/acylaminoacyl peptidase
MKRIVSVVAALVLSSGLASATQPGAGGACGTGAAVKPNPEAPLIPRETLFGNPERAAPQLSHDGKYLSYCSAVNGVLNVFVAPAGDLAKAKPVTNDTSRGITTYFWAFTGKHIIYVQDNGGDENFRVYAVNVETGESKPLTPGDPIKGPDGKPIIQPSGKPLYAAAQIEGVSEKFPTEILVGLNTRDPQFHDLHRVNVETGESKVIFENTEWAGLTTDDDYRIRFANRLTSDASVEWHKRTDAGTFELFETVPSADALTTGIGGFDKTGTIVYMNDSRGRDTGALFAVDLKTGKKTLVAEDPRCDVGGVITHPTEKTIQAVAFNYLRTEWTILDKSIEADLKYLKTVRDGEVNIVDRTMDDTKWLVVFTQSDGPAYVYSYERPASGGGGGKATFLFSNRPALESLALSKVNPVVIKSRDGLNLVSYLTLPSWLDADKNARPDAGPIPMVLFVHGGPWARDSYGYSGYGQWLANRGYAVLQVNFRGSTGFGKSFLNAGNREWAGKMHDDLIDAVNWAVGEKVAAKDRVAIMGGSYGGYATLVGLTFTPDVFACGVNIVGPSNINTLVKTIPPYWAPIVSMFKERVGDFTTDEGRAFLESRSPLNFIDRITKPLLIGQGANDPRVKRTESDQIVAAMAAKKIPVTYVIFPDEGHGFKRPENNMAFNAITEAFLSQNLGGRSEPFSDVLTRSTVEIPHGYEFVPGLKEAPKPAPAATAPKTPAAPTTPAKPVEPSK